MNWALLPMLLHHIHMHSFHNFSCKLSNALGNWSIPRYEPWKTVEFPGAFNDFVPKRSNFCRSSLISRSKISRTFEFLQAFNNFLENYRIPKGMHWFLDPNNRKHLKFGKHSTIFPENYRIPCGLHGFLNPNHRIHSNSLKHSTSSFQNLFEILKKSVDFSIKTIESTVIPCGIQRLFPKTIGFLREFIDVSIQTIEKIEIPSGIHRLFSKTSNSLRKSSIARSKPSSTFEFYNILNEFF